MKGTDKLYLVAEAASGTDLEIYAIDAARKSGVKHVIKLSVTGVEDPFEILAEWHAQVEARLRASDHHNNGLGTTELLTMTIGGRW